jgi:carbonic anhydrase/acetyltransferase-like protein (isoleucine patch superfamily)
MGALVLELEGRRPVIDERAFLAPGAVVVGEVELAAGVSIWYSTVLRADLAPISVGADSNIQDGSVIHVDGGVPCSVGARVTVGHRVVLHGATIGDDVLVGMGAVVMNRATVGEGSLIGAGALVTEGMVVPPGSLVLGEPARVVRPVRPEERAMIEQGAATYVRLAELHRLARSIG